MKRMYEESTVAQREHRQMPARHAALDGTVTRFGDTEDGSAEIDLTPLTNSNCLRHLAMAESKRSLTANSFSKPSNVAASPISINSKVSPSSFSTCSAAASLSSSVSIC